MINLQIIDNSEQIMPALFSSEANVLLHNDEVKALNSVETMQPTIVLLNYRLRGRETMDYIGLIQKASSSSKVVVIAEEIGEQQVLNCLLAGANGYLEVKHLDDYAKKLIKVIATGEAWITRRMVAILLDALRENQCESTERLSV